MKDTDIRFQVGLFASYDEVSPSADNLRFFLDAFADKGLVPTTFQQISIPLSGSENEPVIGIKPGFNRFKLQSSDGVWGVDFLADRMMIRKSNTDIDVTEMGSLGEFATEVETMVDLINQRFPKKYHRLALITTHMLTEGPEVNAVPVKLFNPIPFYRENAPNEWRSRFSARTNFEQPLPELVNVNSELRRVDGQWTVLGKPTPLTGVEVKIDINTFQGNRDYRFSPDQVKAFLQQALPLEAKLLAENTEALTT